MPRWTLKALKTRDGTVKASFANDRFKKTLRFAPLKRVSLDGTFGGRGANDGPSGDIVGDKVGAVKSWGAGWILRT